MNISKRINKIPPYLFFEISKKIKKAQSEGRDIVDFGIGDPDIPTPEFIVDSLIEESKNPINHRYPDSDGMPALREAIANWYDRRFNVKLDPSTEVISLIGAKEGVGHAAFAFLDPGDIALVPDPHYPVYSRGTWFAGADCHFMPLLEKNNFLPDLSSIPKDIINKSKVMWLNYPNNPTGAVADEHFYNEAIEFGINNDIIILHDAAYSEITFDGYKAPSILEFPNAKDISIEFHSLSKAYNMTGWRVGSVVGIKDLISALTTIKSNLDSGLPQAIQHMGIAALNSDDSVVSENIEIYKTRRDRLISALELFGLEVSAPKAGLYLWIKVPSDHDSSSFTEFLLEKLDIVVTPGNGFGDSGEGYIRISLTTPDSDIEKAIERLESVNLNI